MINLITSNCLLAKFKGLNYRDYFTNINTAINNKARINKIMEANENRPMPKVNVIFKYAKYNYVTSVSKETTKEQAAEFFVGSFFNFGSPEGDDDMQRCLAIEYIR